LDRGKEMKTVRQWRWTLAAGFLVLACLAFVLGGAATARFGVSGFLVTAVLAWAVGMTFALWMRRRRPSPSQT
jgi:hypothetical protein